MKMRVCYDPSKYQIKKVTDYKLLKAVVITKNRKQKKAVKAFKTQV